MNLLTSPLLLSLIAPSNAIHHMKRHVELNPRASTSVPLIVSNMCGETIWPGIETQGGTGPSSQGFALTSGSSKSQTVSTDWQGRVWGRTNCTFNSQGNAQSGSTACATGDCGGILDCAATGAVPVTLAEFTLDGGNKQTFFDISIVDGYNVPLAIITQGTTDLPANDTNPSCVATVGDLASQGWDPYNSGTWLGTNSSYPLPFDQSVTWSEASSWCPWDLQVDPPTTPTNGVYPYPDTNIARPYFDPCYSACAKYNKDSYCCTGSYDSPSKCGTNYYSTAAKKVCPDAYSYAYDDETSTFIITQGPGFEVVFCPGGRSTTIIETRSGSTSSASSTSSGSFRPASGRIHPILDALVGTSGWAVLSGLATVVLVSSAFP